MSTTSYQFKLKLLQLLVQDNTFTVHARGNTEEQQTMHPNFRWQPAGFYCSLRYRVAKLCGDCYFAHFQKKKGVNFKITHYDYDSPSMSLYMWNEFNDFSTILVALSNFLITKKMKEFYVQVSMLICSCLAYSFLHPYVLTAIIVINLNKGSFLIADLIIHSMTELNSM